MNLPRISKEGKKKKASLEHEVKEQKESDMI
jgi:hypothetical protein